jgi:alginate O-acetyltransferase complex protein AlgI
MLFNSLDFAIFLPIVFVLYWFVFHKSVKAQNIMLVLASYVFYSWWDWRFLFLILFSTLVDYAIGLALAKKEKLRTRKLLLGLSIVVNLGLLGFFKYFNFFVDSFVQSFSFFGMEVSITSVEIILPVGISFYTFQTLSYTIDVYRRKLAPTKDLVAFMAFISFFPQLVAGPIERATNFLPQFFRKRVFKKDQAIIGIKQIIWGLFKKLVIADTCALYSDAIFDNYQEYSSVTLLLGVFYFAVRMYCDFSGYSDIAIGTARLFDFKLSVNFRYPFFSRNIADYWRRWHISLSSWFRDYVFIPLGGSREGRFTTIRNVMIVFLLSGFWHGASWNFITWGLVCGILYVVFSLKSKKKYSFDEVNPNKLPTIRAFFEMGLVFTCMALTRVFFRTTSLAEAIAYFKQVGSFTFKLDYLGIYRYAVELIPLISILFWWEWYSRNKEFPLFSAKPQLLKTMVVILLIVMFGNFEDVKQFYYFRF